MSNVLHVYAARDEHDEAFLVGDREALLKLRSAIDEAIGAGSSSAHSFAADGEGFRVVVVRHPEERMERLRLPYASPRNSGVGRYPASLVAYSDEDVLGDDEWFAIQKAVGFDYERGEHVKATR